MTRRKLAPWDKILPNQAFNSDRFGGGEDPIERALYETILRVCALRPPAREFKIEQTDMFTIEEMASSPVTLGLLQWLIALSGARRVLEIGTFIGVSAMYLARALPEDGEVVTFEKFDHFAEIARGNFALNGFADKITLIEGDAYDKIGALSKEDLFDIIFIDGNKERYRGYFERLECYLAPRGIMVVDDVFFHGDALNREPATDKGRGVRDFLACVASRDDYHRILLPISNGIMLMLKRPA